MIALNNNKIIMIALAKLTLDLEGFGVDTSLLHRSISKEIQ